MTRLAERPFDLDARRTQIAQTVMVENVIAEMISPRVRVDGRLFIYQTANTEDVLTIPDTKVSRKGRPNEVETGAKDTTEAVEDYALDDPVPRTDRTADGRGRQTIDPMDRATMVTAGLMRLSRERRVATAFASDSNFESDLTKTLSGSSQWSNASSRPIREITDMMDKMLVRPNVLIAGQEVWTNLARHPEIVEAIRGTGAGAVNAAGLVAKEAVAALLQLQAIHVGMAWHNAAKPGQSADYQRLWGKVAILAHIDPMPVDTRPAMPTFAFTAEHMPMQTMTYFDHNRGAYGADIVRVSESVKEVFSFKRAGALFRAAVA